MYRGNGRNWRPGHIAIYGLATYKLRLGLGRAEAERADVCRTDRRRVVRVGRRRRALAQDHARLVDLVEADREDGLQVRDVAGRQPDRLDLGQLAVGRLGRDQRAQRRERRVDAVRAVPLARVRRPPRRRPRDHHRGGVGPGRWRVEGGPTTRVVRGSCLQLTLQNVGRLALSPAAAAAGGSARRQTTVAERRRRLVHHLCTK